MENSIAITGLTKKYANFALQKVSFQLPKGYVMGFIGENGAGKTSTIKAILGMIHPDEGEVRVFGKDLQKNPLLKEEIGVVMDLPFFVEDWTAKMVEKSISPFYSKWNNKTFHQLCAYLHIPMEKKNQGTFSGNKNEVDVGSGLVSWSKTFDYG
ncbi:MAG: ATP-binding cassette domain-containing protein [Clostridiales bacterium]|nr:ATP-binding cassette domain-containing protein [Clostridiales bacterium]